MTRLVGGGTLGAHPHPGARSELAPFGRQRIQRGVPYTVVAHAGANVRRRCYLVVTDQQRDWGGHLPWDRYVWIDADTGAQFDISDEGAARAMVVPTAEADRYAMDLDSFAEEAFSEIGWRPEPCPDRLCPIDDPHHHAARRVQWLTTPWPWDHPKARPLDDIRRAEAAYRDAIAAPGDDIRVRLTPRAEQITIAITRRDR